MSSSVFASGNFKTIQTYQTSSHHCAIKDDKSQSTRNESTVQLLITRVLTETKDGITDDHAEAYEEFLGNVEVIDGEYSDLNYGNPFSDSIDQMRSRLLSYKKEKKDAAFKNIATSITEFDTEKEYSPESVRRMEKNLENFVNELINERLASCGPVGQNQSFNLARQIKGIGEHVGSEKTLQLAAKLEIAVLQTHGKYRALMSDQPISFNSPEAIQTFSREINPLIRNLVPFIRSEAPNISRVHAQKLLTRLYEADDAMIKVGILDEESPIAEGIAHLEKALSVPPRQRRLPTKELERAVTLEPVKKKEKAATSETRSSKFSSLLSKFQEKEPVEPSPSIVRRSTQTPTRTLSPEEKQHQFIERLQGKLARLDKMDSSEIFELMTTLERNKELFSEAELPGIDALISALKTLREPTAFRPSSTETALIVRWGGLLAPYGITSESYERTVNPVQRETKAELIAIIKANGASFAGLNTTLTEAMPRLETKAVSQRFLRAEILERQTKKFTPEMALNLANTVRHLQGFRKESEEYFHSKWSAVVKKFDTETGGKFSGVIEHLGYCDLEKHIEAISFSIVGKHLSRFMSSAFFQKAAAQSPEEFAGTLSGLREEEVTLYQAATKKKYLSVHSDLIWVRDHIDFIKKVYDQGSDLNRNMDSGTCERNSEDRVKLLLRTPHIASDRISMGSTNIGRFNQVARNVMFTIKDAHPEEAIRMLKESYNRVGLSIDRYNKVEVKQGEDPQETLYSELGRLVTEESETIFILGMQGEGSGGHAINIQVDLSKPIFRFIDDNIGVVECPDAKTFKETLTTWLKTAYPDLPNYTLMNLSAI